MSHAQPDMLVFMSDQHTARLLSCAGDQIVETPHLDQLAATGTRFSNTVTSCPLCVPARCSFMTARMPSGTGVFSNANMMPSDVVTLAHSCAAVGYETVLCGRMHFTGQDQRHGFERRIMGDFTPCMPGRGGAKRDDLGPYVETPSWNWAKHFGAGDSPVLAYDRAVVAAALEELAQPHDRPLLMVVGTYGPHHTFVAPPALFDKYYERVDEPIAANDLADAAIHSFDKQTMNHDQRLTTETIRCLRAAYYGLIEHTDHLVGQVRAAWNAHANRQQRHQLFMYTSDHGELAGHRSMWGKMSFYEDAVAIPLIIAGDGVQADRIVDTAVSMVDVPTTIVDYAGGPALPRADGRSLKPALEGKTLEDIPVFSEMMRGAHIGKMLRIKQWKYWNYDKNDEHMLFNHADDAQELINLAQVHRDICADLSAICFSHWDLDAQRLEQELRHEQQKIFNAWGERSQIPEPDRWPIPQSTWALPRLPEQTVHAQ